MTAVSQIEPARETVDTARSNVSGVSAAAGDGGVEDAATSLARAEEVCAAAKAAALEATTAVEAAVVASKIAAEAASVAAVAEADNFPPTQLQNLTGPEPVREVIETAVSTVSIAAYEVAASLAAQTADDASTAAAAAVEAVAVATAAQAAATTARSVSEAIAAGHSGAFGGTPETRAVELSTARAYATSAAVVLARAAADLKTALPAPSAALPRVPRTVTLGAAASGSRCAMHYCHDDECVGTRLFRRAIRVPVISRDGQGNLPRDYAIGTASIRVQLTPQAPTVALEQDGPFMSVSALACCHDASFGGRLSRVHIAGIGV